MKGMEIVIKCFHIQTQLESSDFSEVRVIELTVDHVGGELSYSPLGHHANLCNTVEYVYVYLYAWCV